MPTAEARLQTPRAERYLVQLVDHLTRVGQHGPGQHSQHRPEQHNQHGHGGGPKGQPHGGPPAVCEVERRDRQARIVFDWGRFELSATGSELVLELHADDPRALARGQELIAHRVETIGRREGLAVVWNRPRA